MNDKSILSPQAPASKLENARPVSVKFQKNGGHSFPKNLRLETESVHHNVVREAKFLEFENETIQKQRQEMQLLIGELRSRDRELNDMVTGHRKQLMAWEQDRTRIVAVEEKCSRYERELHGRNEDIYNLTAKLRAVESEEESRQMAIRNMQDQLNSVTEQHCLTSQRLNEAQEINRGLGRTIKELKSAGGQHEQREQELFQLLSSKDRDLSEAASHIAEISTKLKRCEFQLQESHQANSDLKRLVSEWRNKHAELGRELDHAKKQNAKLEEFSAKLKSDVQQLRQQLITARSEVTMSNEREQRKEELLQLQKSKQERTDAELAALRELCEIQQRDLSLLQSNLETAKNLLNCRQKSFNQDRGGVNYSTSQMFLPSQSVTSTSCCDSPVRSFLKTCGSPAAKKDADATEPNINNHANLLLSRFDTHRVSESPKVTSWSNPNPSIPVSLERKSYDWQGSRLLEDLSEKQSAVELDESPTKDVMNSDLGKSSTVMNSDLGKSSTVKSPGRAHQSTFLYNRNEGSISSSNRLVTASLVQSHMASPWEGLDASVRTRSVLSQRGSWNVLEPRVATSTDSIFPGSSSNLESDDDVVMDELSIGDQMSANEDSGEGDKTLAEAENQVERGKRVGRESWKNEDYAENEGNLRHRNSAVQVTGVKVEKSVRTSSVAENECSLREGSVGYGVMAVREDASVKDRSIVSNHSSSGNYNVPRLSSTSDDYGSMSDNYYPSKLSAITDDVGSQSVNYCPYKLSSTKDDVGSQSMNYCPSKLPSTKDDVGSQSVNYYPSKLSSTKDDVGSQSMNYCPSKLSSTTDDVGSQSVNYCPSKLACTKDDVGSQSMNYCPSKLSSAKDDTGCQSVNYCPSKLSSAKDDAGCQSVNYCPSKLSSAKDDVGSQSVSPSILSAVEEKNSISCRSPYNFPSKPSLSEVEADSQLPSSGVFPSKLEGDGGYKLDDKKLSSHNDNSGPELENRSSHEMTSLRGDGSLESENICSCKMSLIRGDRGPESKNSFPHETSSLKDDASPDFEKTCSSRASSVSSVGQYSLQSVPANYGSERKTGEIKFPILSYRSGHWSASYEKLSEAVGKDWARSRTWNSTIVEPTDRSAMRQMSSAISGRGRVGGQQDEKVDLKMKSEANASNGKDKLQQDLDEGAFLQEEGRRSARRKGRFQRTKCGCQKHKERSGEEDRETVLEIFMESKYCTPASGTSKSSSRLDVFADALA